MISLKLEYNNDFVILTKSSLGAYTISCAKDWIYLTKFSSGKLITKHPRGQLETIVDRKFIYNQDFELGSDIDFKYRFILPLGNISKTNSYPNGSCQFTGNFNGNNFTMGNINIIDCENNGLFGSLSSSIIKNLKIANVVILDGTDNGVLAGKATNVEITNITILGNMLIKGKNSSCFVGSLEGNIKNIRICVDGVIEAKNRKSIISNIFHGLAENCCLVSNLSNSVSCFNVINGRLKNSCYHSFNSIDLPFFQVSKYHQVYNCYYFQLNNEELKPPQNIINSFYKNLDKVEPVNLQSDFSTTQPEKPWKQIDSDYFLLDNLNYTNHNTESNEIIFYNITLNKSNVTDYIDSNGNFVSDIKINPYDENKIMEDCLKMKIIYDKEIIANKKYSDQIHKNNMEKLSFLLNQIKSEDPTNLKFFSMENELNESNENYESFSEYYSSDEKTEPNDLTEQIPN